MSKSISKKKRGEVFLKYDGKCSYCGVDIELNTFHIDHIKPLYRGYTNQDLEKYNITKGGSSIKNLNPSCPSCNISKSTFTIDKWRYEIFKKIARLRRDNSNFRLLERYGVIKISHEDIKFHFEKIQDGRG